jgi:hypothetical protein
MLDVEGERAKRRMAVRAPERLPVPNSAQVNETGKARQIVAEIGVTHEEARRVLAKHGGDRKSKHYQGANNTLIRGSTNADYLTARIARDRPDILERMKAGEYPSVRAAAIDGRERE